MSSNLLIKELDRLKRENSRLRRTLSVFASEQNWVYASNSDLLQSDTFAFVPDNEKVREKPFEYARRAISYKHRAKRGQVKNEEPKTDRFTKLL